MDNTITSYGVGDILLHKWVYPKTPDGKWLPATMQTTGTREFNVPCIVVFGPGQDKNLEDLKKVLPKDKKIIFQSKKAVNNREGHGYPKFRNTLVIIDKCEEQTLPEVP